MSKILFNGSSLTYIDSVFDMQWYLEIKKVSGGVMYSFEDDMIKTIIYTMGLSEQQHRYLANREPFNKAQLTQLVHQLREKGKEPTLTRMEEDLSFESFWNAYDHKVGKKAQVKKLWESLGQDEQATAMAYIKKYDRRLANTSVNKLYPHSYLNRKEYNN